MYKGFTKMVVLVRVTQGCSLVTLAYIGSRNGWCTVHL